MACEVVDRAVRPGASLLIVADDIPPSLSTALEVEGARFLRVTSNAALDAVQRMEPDGIVVVGAPALGGRLAASSDRPVLSLGADVLGLDLGHVREALQGFVRELASGRSEEFSLRLWDTRPGLGQPEAMLAGHRIALVGEGPARVDRLARELRAHGAAVVVAEANGAGLEAARLLDPQVVLIGSEDPGGRTGSPALPPDSVLRWSFVLRFEWSAIARDLGMDVRRLASRVAPFVAIERALERRVASRPLVQTTLDLLGPSRLLRSLGGVDERLRVEVRTSNGRGEMDLTSTLVLGARWWQDGRSRPDFTGLSAVAAFLSVDEAWVRVSHRKAPRSIDIVLPVEEALLEAKRIADSIADEVSTNPQIQVFSSRPPPPLPEFGALEPEESGVQRKRARPSPRETANDLADLSVPPLPPLAPPPLAPPPLGPRPTNLLDLDVLEEPVRRQIEPPAPRVSAKIDFTGRLAAGLVAALMVAFVATVVVSLGQESEPAPGERKVDLAGSKPVGPRSAPAAAAEAAAADAPAPVVAPARALHSARELLSRSAVVVPLEPSEARRRSDDILEALDVDPRQATTQLEEAFTIAPHNPHVAAAMARLCLRRGRGELALSWARRAARQRRRDPRYRVLIGDVQHALGRPERAQRTWLGVLRAHPGHRGARRRLRGERE